ncbi:hypothetical protein LTR37_009937 [Vermiconidia calcicola]|uniref:Uncharacterized protein n=1 Tax=Vermiconidia calcicola TaxID=1690605 RepID=A0ACC3N7F1_9PEZI|nr:hypothetical protein LTR37_009937 [Vermiconidia calcicola]
MSTDIAGLREQIIANALTLFPDTAGWGQQPACHTLHVDVTAVANAGNLVGYQARLIVLSTSGPVEALLEGKAANFTIGGNDAGCIASALGSLFRETALTLMKCHGKSFSQAAREGLDPNV